MKFVHLHTHSEYSILDGAVRTAKLIEAALKNGMEALALTDHGNLFGAIEFYKAARNAGIKPIIGMEAYIARGSRKDKKNQESPHHLTLLAINERGFKNLIRLSTEAYLTGFYYKPRIDKELLQEFSEGLVALSGCLKGEIPSRILIGDFKGAEDVAKKFIDIFGRENFYLELMDLGIEENRIVNRHLVELSKSLGVGLVATNDVHFLKREDQRVHDVIICIQTGKKLNDKRRLRSPSPELYFRSQEEMVKLFEELPDALRNTVEIAERAELELILDPQKVHLPTFELPEGFVSDHEYLKKLALEGLRRKISPLKEEYLKRLNYELDVINKLGYTGYFLIIWDIVKKAKEMNVPVGPGRGSAVGSLVLYALDVTQVDPIKFGLLFERFLNPERISPPDVDIDFADISRDKVIEYVKDRFGRESVAQIITFGRMLSRAAIRDVGRVLDIPYGEVDKIAKLVPHLQDMTLRRALTEIRELKNLVDSKPVYQELMEIAEKIEGLVRNVSTHAAGVVIAPGKIWEYTPLYMSTDGVVSTQFDMKSLEELGLLKIDFLGLRTLTVIQWAEEEIRKREPEFSIDRVPLDDKKTFRMIAKGNTLGVFQMESKGFREMLQKLRPKKFEDIIIALSLYRPGPLQSGNREALIARRTGKEPVSYPIPQLKDVLKETYGVFLYQEQVMQIAAKVAGFTLAQADVLRRAMGKKKSKIMDEQKAAFIEGALKNGISRKTAEKIFEDIRPFAKYGFNKSHSTGYAFISYWTAYLKANYPAEFMTACLSTEMQAQNFQEKIHKLVREAKRLRIKVFPPDINESFYKFTLTGEKSIAYGLGAIKNVGEGAVEEIVRMREEGGNFVSLDDFLERVDFRKVNKKVTESLIKAGAFDKLYPNRTLLLKKASETYQMGKKSKRLPSLFTAAASKPEKKEVIVEKEDVTTRLTYEKEVLGFFLTGHPLDKFKKKVRNLPHIPSQDLEEGRDGESVALVGTLVGLERKRDRQGRIYAVVTFEDYEGEFSGLLFADIFNKVAPNLIKEESYYIKGTLLMDEEGERGKIKITSLASLSSVEIPGETTSLRVCLNTRGLNDQIYEKLIEILKQHTGKFPLEIQLLSNGKKYLLRSRSIKVSWDGILRGRIMRLLGEKAICEVKD